MDSYPQNLVNQYLKTSHKLKKFDRVVFKRFAPNVNEVLEQFLQLALKFEEAGIYSYAAMCRLGVAKCEMSTGNINSECFAYLKAARDFIEADNAIHTLNLLSNRGEYREGALRCYGLALERSADDGVIKAAIIREMATLQPHYDDTSNFNSPSHRIYELELGALAALKNDDLYAALQQLDDIADNVYERKQHTLYADLLRNCEITRVLLLISLDLPPVRQSPSHIKLIEYYHRLGNFDDVFDGESEEELFECDGALVQQQQFSNNWNNPGAFVPVNLRYALGELVAVWTEDRYKDLKILSEQFLSDFKILNQDQRIIIDKICRKLEKHC